ncbi:MAG: hypothetical protein HOW73_35365 [Polyangiaceae bacterium]|nr:hypothetical protein [Polyangiaceae bacterium]
MATPWTDATKAWPTGPYTNFIDNDDPTHPVIVMRRLMHSGFGPNDFRDRIMDVAAKVDGDVLSAILRVYPTREESLDPRCLFDMVPSHEGHYFYDLLGNDNTGDFTNPFFAQGFMMGSYTDLVPTIVYKGVDSFGWRGGGQLLVRKHGKSFVSRPEPGLPGTAVMTERGAVNVMTHGEEVYYLGAGASPGIYKWSARAGEVTILDLHGDASKGLFDLYHDGTSLVWARGEGPPPAQTGMPYPERTLWTAPLPKDNEPLEPRLLGPAPYEYLGEEPLLAGCGYAAHMMPGITTNLAFVVRLSDGKMWRLPHSDLYFPQGVIGVTCEHLYLDMSVTNPYHISATTLRVPIASLPEYLPE